MWYRWLQLSGYLYEPEITATTTYRYVGRCWSQLLQSAKQPSATPRPNGVHTAPNYLGKSIIAELSGSLIWCVWFANVPTFEIHWFGPYCIQRVHPMSRNTPSKAATVRVKYHHPTKARTFGCSGLTSSIVCNDSRIRPHTDVISSDVRGNLDGRLPVSIISRATSTIRVLCGCFESHPSQYASTSSSSGCCTQRTKGRRGQTPQQYRQSKAYLTRFIGFSWLWKLIDCVFLLMRIY